MTVDRAHKEKRDFIRMKIDAPLRAQIKADGLQLPTQGWCHELSGGGMQLITQQPLPEGEELEVSIASEHGHNPSLTARVKVVRCQSEEGAYRSGLEIIEMLG